MASTILLGRDDPSPFTVENEGGSSRFVLICDHAGRATPQSLGDLGVPPFEFDRHIAWDIGAGALTSRLSSLLDAAAIRQTYSRLVIDCNRPIDSPTLIVDIADGTIVPSNCTISSSDRQRRIEEIYAPYHERIDQILRHQRAGELNPVLVLVHSFTPRMGGMDRPWRFGVLHMHDSPASAFMLKRLRHEMGDAVGDNQPYAMDGTDFTAPHHSRTHGCDYLELEVRQDLLADADGCAGTAQWLAAHLRAVLEDLLS